MPLLKAFQMMFRIGTKVKGMSTVELGREVAVEQKTSWFFKRKMQIAMQGTRDRLLVNNVEMDETLVGGYSEGQPGRSHVDKQVVMVAIEKLDDGRVGNIGLARIEGFGSDTFEQAVDMMVAPDARITTDDFVSWKALEGKMPLLGRKKSEKGKAFPQMHIQIMLVKMWLRGIHHRCSEKSLQGYLDEYAFRFNNRNQTHKVFDILLAKIMRLQPHPFVRPKKLCALNT